MFQKIHGEVGVTLVSVMIILLLMTLLGTGLLTSALMENKIIHNLEDQKQALYLAQAGIEYARYELQKDLTWRSDSFTQLLGNGQFDLQVIDIGEQKLKIRSIGTVGQTSRTIEIGANYTLAGTVDLVEQLAQYTVLGGGDLIFTNHTTFKGKGDLRSNGDITITGHLSIDGDIVATGGVEAPIDPSQVAQGENAYNIPLVDWDELEAEALATGRYLTGWNESSFQNDVVNYINKSVTISKNGINLTLDGILVIRGDWIVSTKTKIRSTSGLMIFVDGNILFENQTEIDAAIYATGAITFENKTVLSGAIYSEETVTATNNTEITLEPQHLYQTLISEVLIPTGSGDDTKDSMTITYWNEL